jgi:hypothetical protein
VRALQPSEDIVSLDEAQLAALPVGPAGRVAIAELLSDQQLLRDAGHSPVLECVRRYQRDDVEEVVATDVYSFHIDRATEATDTFLCSYTGPASEGLRNDEAVRRVDVPAVRAQLLAQFGGEEGDEFTAWLEQCCYDLHFQPRLNAQPFSFGVGNLWRIAVAHPGSLVPACIHRAPATAVGDPARLLLIS